MNSENVPLHQPPPSALNPNDCFRILERIFYDDQSSQSIDAIFKHFEANFRTQPNLINTIIDFYFDVSNKLSSLNESAVNINIQICRSNSKTIVDLIFLVPDDLASKVFERIAEKLNNSPSSSSNTASLNLTISAQHAWLKTFERTLTLLRLIAYNKKSWLSKLLIHNLFAAIIKLIKINSNLNDQIVVEASLFFVGLINVVPLQILTSHLDNVFQTFICLLRHFTYLEQNKLFPDDITWRSIKWSIRLFFYACYGLFPAQFIQNFRKKDHYLINKEFIRSTTFYLRFHPSLMRDKNDSNEKQLKQTAPNCDDYSLEWRQYCLDSMCTNYNQVIHDIGLQGTMYNQISAMKLSHVLVQKSTKPNVDVDSYSKMINNQLLLSNTSSDTLASHMSPSSYFSNSNQRISLQDFDSSLSKKSTNSSFANQNSMPTTPNLINSSSTGVFQYPVRSDTAMNKNMLEKGNEQQITQPNNNSIKNLTLQFMLNDTETIGDWMTSEKFSKFINTANESTSRSVIRQRRSNSDSKLLSGCQNLTITQSKNTKDDKSMSKDTSVFPNKQIKSEMRDRNIKDPMSVELLDDISLSRQRDLSSISIARTAYQLSLLNSNSTSTLMDETISDSNDILKNYLTGIRQNKPTNETSTNQEIFKLKQDLKHLAIQLVYERHLRNKYEEDSNRLYFFKIQCEQLKEEKIYLEKNVKELVEQYKREVEECMSEQKKVSHIKRKEEFGSCFI